MSNDSQQIISEISPTPIPEIEQPKLAVTFSVGDYNQRRFSRPWIALISGWDVGGYPALKFGSASSCQAEVAAAPGALVKYGQKDNRGHAGTNEFGIVSKTGEIQRITEGEAKKAFRDPAFRHEILNGSANLKNTWKVS